MPSIFIDPSERTTRLQDSVVRAAVSVPGLETYTGADILLSVLGEPVLTNLNNPTRLEKIKLEKHLAAGMLIQRKTTDLLASIPYLKESLAKMLVMEPKYGSWLLFVGDMTLDHKTDKAKINGQESRWDWSVLRSTICKWQWRGGFVDFLKYDNMVAGWINNILETMTDIEKTPEVVIEQRKPQQVIISPQVDELYQVSLRALMAFPDIGLEKAKAIIKYCGTLAQAYTFLSDPSNLVIDGRPRGIGPTTFANFSRWLGLKPGETLAVDSETTRALWHDLTERNV